MYSCGISPRNGHRGTVGPWDPPAAGPIPFMISDRWSLWEELKGTVAGKEYLFIHLYYLYYCLYYYYHIYIYRYVYRIVIFSIHLYIIDNHII